MAGSMVIENGIVVGIIVWHSIRLIINNLLPQGLNDWLSKIVFFQCGNIGSKSRVTVYSL
jgi:hypothetical protein